MSVLRYGLPLLHIPWSGLRWLRILIVDLFTDCTAWGASFTSTDPFKLLTKRDVHPVGRYYISIEWWVELDTVSLVLCKMKVLVFIEICILL